MSNPSGYDKLIECPYNRAHQVLASRMQTHLVKCRKNYPEVEKVECPFNSTHLVNKPELASHAERCPDAASFINYKYSVQTNAAKKEPEFKPVMTQITGGESWDDCDVPTYDPQKYCENAPVIRQLNVARPSEKNAFREAEKRRLDAMKNKK